MSLALYPPRVRSSDLLGGTGSRDQDLRSFERTSRLGRKDRHLPVNSERERLQLLLELVIFKVEDWTAIVLRITRVNHQLS